MYVHELMTKDPVYVHSETTVHEVIELMQDRDVRHVPVVDSDELVGLVSDRDLRHISWTAVADGSGRRLNIPVSHFMSGDVLSVGSQDDVSAAIDLMIEHKVGAIPVVDEGDGSLVGIVSYMDVLKHARDVL